MLRLSSSSRRRFDPVKHITAGQLRAMGFYLSETLPDTAFVRRLSVGLDDHEKLDDGTATLRLVVDEPFDGYRRSWWRWLR